MATYIWTVKDKSGKSVVREITHNSVEESKAVLLAAGCSELKLVSEEVMDQVHVGFKAKSKLFGEEIKVTAEDRVKYMFGPPPTYWRVLRSGLEQSKWFTLGILLWGAFLACLGHTSGAVMAFAALFVWVTFLMFSGLPRIYYRRLLEASEWHRWNEVLNLVATLRKVRKVHFTKMPETDLTYRRAVALAGLGHLSQGLDEYRQCENQPGCPSWMYKAMVANIYDRAKQYDVALALVKQAISENQNQSLYLNLTNRLARYHHDLVGARNALIKAEETTFVEHAKPFHLRCRGVLAYFENNLIEARKELEASLTLTLDKTYLPFRDGHLSVARGYLCCVLAKQGDLSAARICFDQAREYLDATGQDDLLAECQKLLAGKA